MSLVQEGLQGKGHFGEKVVNVLNRAGTAIGRAVSSIDMVDPDAGRREELMNVQEEVRSDFSRGVRVGLHESRHFQAIHDNSGGVVRLQEK